MASIRGPGGVGFQTLLVGGGRHHLHVLGLDEVVGQPGIQIDHVADLAARGVEKLPHLIDRVDRDPAAGMPCRIAESGPDLLDLSVADKNGPVAESDAAGADEHGIRLVVGEAVAVDAAALEGRSIEHHRFLVAGQIPLIDGNLAPLVMNGPRQAIDKMAVNRLLRNPIHDGLVSSPTPVYLRVYVEPQLPSAAGSQQRLPASQGDRDLR